MAGDRPRVWLALSACVWVCACGAEPTTPTSVKPVIPTLVVACDPTPALRCTATVPGRADVTAGASWSAAESFRLAMDLPVTASDAVVFRSPGIPTAVTARNVYIRADYYFSADSEFPRGLHIRDIAPHAYSLASDGSAIPLAYITASVSTGAIGAPGSVAVPDATVTIITGEGAGTTKTTGVNGSCMIEFLRLGRPFTGRASKPGYSHDTRDHPGALDTSEGYPFINDTIHFTIAPLGQ